MSLRCSLLRCASRGGVYGLVLGACALAWIAEGVTWAAATPSVSKPAGTERARVKKPKKATHSKKPPSLRSALPAALQAVEANYLATKTLVAQFEQTESSAALGTQKVSRGQIRIKHPDLLRWETRAPDSSLVVTDGKRLWFYTPPFDAAEPGQLIERSAAQVQSRLANALLSGSFSILGDMKIESLGSERYAIRPPRGSAGSVERAEFEIDPKSQVIKRVRLEHRGGNRSEVVLSQISLGDDLDDQLFKFTPPPNTQRVQE